MGFGNFLGKLFGAGRALEKEVQNEAHRSEIAAKKLVKLAKEVEGKVRKLTGIRKPMASHDLLDQPTRNKIERLTRDLGSDAGLKRYNDMIVSLVAQYSSGMMDALFALHEEYKLSQAATQERAESVRRAFAQERKALRRKAAEEFHAALDRSEKMSDAEVERAAKNL